jgi:hypothetical protein
MCMRKPTAASPAPDNSRSIGFGPRLTLAALGAFSAFGATAQTPTADSWWLPDSGRRMPAKIAYADSSGAVQVINTAGALDTQDHAFFTGIGSNGRACVTCHQPANAMSVSVATIQARWQATAGADPRFNNNEWESASCCGNEGQLMVRIVPRCHSRRPTPTRCC